MRTCSPLHLFKHFLLLCFIFFLSNATLQSQDQGFVGTKSLMEGNKIAFQTIPKENTSEIESLNDHLYGLLANDGPHYVLGGTVLWWGDDQGTAAIANKVTLSADADFDVVAWGLNSARISRYSNENNIPYWVFPTAPIDPYIDFSDSSGIFAAAVGPNFYLFDTTGGPQFYNLTLPDSLYASFTGVSRDGSMAVLLASPFGNSNTARVYAFDVSFGTTTIAWTYDVPANVISNWTGVNFSASGSKVVINGRNHLYVFNSADGSLIWDRFLDNTESPAAISGDGKVVVTGDNSGFVQTWVFDGSSEYNLLWQYRVPVVAGFTDWASSVDVSADGNTILAGTLMFINPSINEYEGWVIAFDTYGDGIPKWIFQGAGDLVDDIAISDDGRVAAAVTWGDLYQPSRRDLLVFDVATGDVTFDVFTPGSFFTCDISPDGKRVFAGGKAVHAREFGNGGRIYLCEIELGGGNVSGNVDLANTSDDSGVLVKAEGTVRSAVTDINGNYIIQNIPAGTYTISAGKQGYNFGQVNNVNVTEGNTTTGVNFSLASFTPTPPTLTASTGLVGIIELNFIPTILNPERQKEIARMLGDDYYPPNSPVSTKLISESNDIVFNSSISQSLMGLDSIAIYRGQLSGGPYTRIAGVPASQETYIDSNVFALRDYYYVITSFNDIGESVYSNEALGQVSDTLLTFSFETPEASIPTIDGVLSPGEWDDAIKIDISDIFGYGGGVPQPQGSVYMYFKFDDNTDMLYVGGEDFLNPTLDDREGFGLYFDDNNNNVFDNTPPFISEGNFWAYWHPSGADLVFRELPTYVQDTLSGAQVEFTDGSGHLQGEVAIPMGFMEGYQLQVFSPDKITGLGAFIIARQGNTALFNGWWPQTMNTLFNPTYFGDVGIDVSLDAPPQAPSNISVTKQGQDLLLTWTDPSLGLNNEQLPVPPTINIYKNGEFLTSVSAGVQSYVDNDVYCLAWYEYQLDASIEVDSVLTSPISAPVGIFACGDPALVPIKYDDDEWNGFYVVSFDSINCKFAVRFTPESYPANVRRLVTTANSNDDFDFTVQRDDGGLPGDIIAGPYRVYGSNLPGTVNIVTKTLPGIDPPEITSGDFWVVINWLKDTPGSPGIGVDVQYVPPTEYRSYYYTPWEGWVSMSSPSTTFNIMITAYVSDQPVGIEENDERQLPLTFEMKQNYPNPFNPSTIINYELPKNQTVTLEVFDALGQKVRTLVNETQEAGNYNVTWDGKNNGGNSVTSGVYFYRINTDSFTKVMKMMLLR